MKGFVLTSASSTKSSSAPLGERSETRDSCYFPGCRRDTNCSCEICIASINATLDLMPSSAQHSSLTRISSTPQRTPVHVRFDPLIVPSTPPLLLQSTAKSRPLEEENSKKKKKKGRRPSFVSWAGFLRFLLGVSLIFAADSGFSWAFSGAFRPVFSAEKVRRIGEESANWGSLDGRLRYVEKKLGEMVHGKVSNCSSADSIWELNQDGFLLVHSRCILYKSGVEEVNIWGWPLQTAGLLTTGFSSTYYTILSGRITEWSEGKIRFSIHKSNSSWTHRKWSASALQLDQKTWVLEYRQNAFLENSRPCKVALELLIFRFSKVIQGLKQEFWSLVTVPYTSYHKHYSNHHKEDGFRYHAT